MTNWKKFNTPILIQPTREMPKWLGVIGAGTIGPDIAYYLKSTIPDLKLVLIDINEDALDKAVERICAYAEKGRKRGKLSDEMADNVKENIMASTDYQALAYCDWVIEAATENIELKKKIFSMVEEVVSERAIITSNSSSIPAEMIFSHLQHPQRTTITHFFAPAFQNPAVEIVEWEKSDGLMIQYLRWLFYVTDKTPILTRDKVCFMLDRIFDNWCNEAALLLDKATPAQIDSVASEFVHVGPFFVLNFANGNAIIIETNALQAEIEGEHYAPAKIFETAGEWETVKPGEKVEVEEKLAEEIRDRLLGILFSQSVDILDREIGKAEDLDLGSRLAFAFKKGPLELMRELGAEESERILNKFTLAKPGMPKAKRTLESYTRFRRFILIDELEGIKIISLRRPDALNALHDEMNQEIMQVLQEFENDPEVKGFVIAGYGVRAFSAGADIGRFPEMLGNKSESIEYARSCSALLNYLDTCKKPVVAALNGMALGGGLELALRCHGIVAVREAWMQFPEITLGIVPGIGGLVVPYRRWPDAAQVFHGMLTKAEKLGAEKAAEIGMIHTLVDKQMNLIPAGVWLARDLADSTHQVRDEAVTIAPIIREINEPYSATGQALSPAVLKLMCAAIQDAAAVDSFADALEIGYTAFGDSACTDAAREGIESFMSGSRPDFQKTG
ncbi:MAG: 3-hydroxyacyl-CoA dehydrogenase/enoyl-CoA hydratase family protein [Gammaproteobacteria bacterium]|nr:3-hydroxyacyl-CoA dehydrogenase/enoyl-CoA hydratase family protein [Gammaproteobacteria bacterium]